MPDTGEKSANLSPQQAEALFPGLLARQTKQKRQHWKQRGVPWDVIGPLLMARPSESPARPSQQSTNPTLSAPEADMSPDDRRAWELFVEFAKNRKGQRAWEWGMVSRFVAHIAEVGAGKARQPKGQHPDSRKRSAAQ